jgi:hypothetical protein
MGDTMKITCPSCHYECGIIVELIPEEGKFVTCPECKNRFAVAKPKPSKAADERDHDESGASPKRKATTRLIIAIAAILLIGVGALAYYKISTSKGEKEIADEFVAVVTKHIDNERDKEEYNLTKETTAVFDRDGKPTGAVKESWRKTVEKDNLQYEYDIVKSDSIVAPYTGTYIYEVVQYVTPLYPTKEAALYSTDLTYTKSMRHTLTYDYESGHWIYKSDRWEQVK